MYSKKSFDNMKMIRNLIIGLAALLCFTQCQREKDTSFLIQAEQVGPLSKGTPSANIESLFVNDSVIRDTTTGILGSAQNKIRI